MLSTSPGSNPQLPGVGNDGAILGGRAGPSAPRVPGVLAPPGGQGPAQAAPEMALPSAIPLNEIPVYSSLDFPEIRGESGPPDGLTLDAAIERLVRENIYLRAVAFELPQAEADILTASLRANPIFYADTQLVPYGQYTKDRPGGQTQYDVNVSIPLDVSFKRRARVDSASKAKRVLEQQYRDAVRLQIDNLYKEYVNVLASRVTLRYAEASVQGLNRILVPVKSRFDQGATAEADYLRVLIQKESAEIGRRDAEEQLRRSKRGLASLLNIPPQQADQLEVRDSLLDRVEVVPAEADLIDEALRCRPDLVAYRLGVSRAEADVKLAMANRYNDIYLLYQPYTFQSNEPQGLKSPTSWAVGLTVPMPIFNRNQGNIQRARLNVGQTQTQLAAQMRLVITEVQQANMEYTVTREALQRFETTVSPIAKKILADTERRTLLGQENLIVLLGARNDFALIVKQYLDTMVRHRRAMLELNTAVGRRVLP